MSTIKTGFCPSCGKDRELAFFQFGVIKSTMCVFCLKRYLEDIVIPHLAKSYDISDEQSVIEVFNHG